MRPQSTIGLHFLEVVHLSRLLPQVLLLFLVLLVHPVLVLLKLNYSAQVIFPASFGHRYFSIERKALPLADSFGLTDVLILLVNVCRCHY